MHRSFHTHAIEEQTLILDDLKNAPYLSEDFPKIPFCDFKLIAKQVSQERSRKKHEIKWQQFLSCQDKIIVQKLNNINYHNNNLPNIIFDELLDIDSQANLTQEEIKFPVITKRENCVNLFFRNNRVGKKHIPLKYNPRNGHAPLQGLKKSELYFILKKVKRERKKIQDEKNWQYFNQNILKNEVEMKREILISDNHIDNSIIHNICENQEFENMCCTCRSSENIVDEENLCSLNAKVKNVTETNSDITKFNEIKQGIIPLIKSINNLLKENSKSLSTEINVEQMEKKASHFITRFKRDFMRDEMCLVRNSRNLTNNSEDILTIPIASKFMNAFSNFLQALKVIERELQKKYFIKPIINMLSSFFTQSYTLLVLNKYFYGNNEDHMEVENLLIESLQLLNNTTVQVGNITTLGKGLCNKIPGEPHTPSWKKESVALARIKFGPPDRTRNEKLLVDGKGSQHEESEEVEKLYFEMDTLSICSSLNKSSKSPLNINIPVTNSPQGTEKETLGKENGLKCLLSSQSGDKRVGNDELSLIEETHEKKLGDTVLNQESFSKMIAKKIQEISGVDYELRKVEDLRIKMMSILLNIKVSISKNFNSCSLPVDENYERIQQRTIEFGARFKRNYLYRTKCQLNELKTVDANLFLIKKKSKILNILQKIGAAHQGILQSLQVIEKQLQTISASGLTQEVFFTFYWYIYELTFKLKKFYGFTHSQVLDDVEKLAVETIKLLKELKCEQDVKLKTPAKITDKKIKTKTKQTKEGKHTKNDILMKKKSPYASKLVKKQSKQSVNKNEEKPVEESKEEKGLNFMMNIKQRRGAVVRIRQNLNLQDPKTMVEMLAEHESNLENVEPPDINTQKSPESRCNDTDISPISSNEIILPKVPEKVIEDHKKDFPQNVKLITIKRIESTDDKISRCNEPKGKGLNVNHFWDGLIKYKEEFTKYKTSNPLYSKESLQTVKSLTEKLMDEALYDSLTKVLNTINIQDISALKNVMEEEIK